MDWAPKNEEDEIVKQPLKKKQTVVDLGDMQEEID